MGSDITNYSPTTSTGAVLSIGATLSSDGTTYQNFFTGSIAAVQLYNRQLSSTEIIQNHNALKSRFNL
jgi:hypothetical protein